MSTKKDLAEKEPEQVQNEIKPKKTTAEKGVKYFEGKAKDGRATEVDKPIQKYSKMFKSNPYKYIVV